MLGAVSSALRGANGKTVEVYFDEADPFKPPFRDVELYTVYAISVDGVSIREYDDVAAAWSGDNVVGIFVGGFFLLAGLLTGALGVWSFFNRR
jgi:hypothetical protein